MCDMCVKLSLKLHSEALLNDAHVKSENRSRYSRKNVRQTSLIGCDIMTCYAYYLFPTTQTLYNSLSASFIIQ